MAGRELVRIEEDRRRLLSENKALLAQERRGFQILQEVLAELPWPVLGIDEFGQVALANDAALRRFAERGLLPGVLLDSVLPGVVASVGKAGIEIDGVEYRCRWREVGAEEGRNGRLLLLEEVTP